MDSLASVLGRGLALVDARAGTDLERTVRASVKAAPALAPDRRARARMFLAGWLLGSRRVRRPLAVRVRGPYGEREFVLPDSVAMAVLEEVFSWNEYAVDLPHPPRRILDLGSNVGASILFFALRYPEAQIVGVEASPKLFGVLRRNVGDLPNVTLIQAAVSSTDEPIRFFEGNSSWEGSTRVSGWVREEAATEVAAVTLDELIADGGADLVKIDIEGGEFDVLPASRRLAEVPVVLGEIHAAPGTPEAEAVLALFEGAELVSTDPGPANSQWTTVFSAVRRDRVPAVSARG
ncbi:FkbM family methyltransferase [Solirubrobacter sp. CPCC 204708]|uniref:FkbM family methyltransferase n=1 Tax=Solirubrobacter deserti TaxID=2282478 RepID=A0ABT4RM56_9ACTN|nr:FkbM family methyltransferase [Solirubrobacter deserti]MBE2317978.1 FkbM family methyltransferase [Solirubrobacter deserti]MDA0139657.1 FkbM family methyltransferase [Solirubrobacter deserti]